MVTIKIDPITRIEGHLKIEAVVDGGVVKEARSSGTLFRGFEKILKGRDPRDAQRITQRVCGVCPTAHAMTSTLNLDSAFGIDGKIPDNGRIARNLILGCNFIQSHILHFYHLAALDYVDVTSVADYEGKDPALRDIQDFIKRGQLGPFVPRYEGDYRLGKELDQTATSHYVEALKARRKAHEMLAIFGGKMPHSVAIVPGGVTEQVTTDKITSFLWKLKELQRFIDEAYIPDVLAVAGKYPDYFEIGAGCGRFLSYGVFDLETAELDLLKRNRFLKSGLVEMNLQGENVEASKISESVKHSWYDEAGAEKHPSQEETIPKHRKEGAYSWIKSPRYDGRVCEVGPLARMLASYTGGQAQVKQLIDSTLQTLEAEPKVLFSVLGRHAARALETKAVADAMAGWLLELKPGEAVCTSHEVPEEAEGVGLTEAPRGALGHWIKIENKRIARYQLVVPTTWNASPKDANGQPGPIEQALIGTKVKDEDNPFEIVRIVRSFDPCLACAIHLIDGHGNDLGKYRVS